METNNITNIVIADDHPIFLSGLNTVISSNSNNNIVGEAKNGLEAVELVRKHQPGIVILDIDMPKMNGIEASEIICSEFPDSYIIILTMHKDRNMFLRLMDIGIHGYVLKENAVIDIDQCITTVKQGGLFISPVVSQYLLGKTPKEEKKPEGFDSLTPTEIKVLKMISESKTTKTISEELFVSQKTVTNHRYNISQKLNIKGSNSLLLYALKHKQLISSID